jgi:hypothetical protein
MNQKKVSVVSALLLPMLLILIAPSCKKYVDPPPYFEDTIATVKPVLRKVLIIGVDGAVGAEYKIIQPAVLVGLQAHSKYSWDAVSDESTTDAASWKTLMSGISYSRHAIQDSSFIYTQPAGGAPHGTITSYPSFFNYILSSSKPDIKTTFISQWPELANRLVPEVEDKVLVASDAAVKDSAVARIKKANAELVVVNFNSVAVAGKTYGFSATAAGYKTAVLTVDGYIGEIMSALKARPEYNKNEEWLVIITGTHGGTGITYGGPSEKEANVFSFYYNEKLKPREFIKGGAFTGVQLKGRDAAAVKAELPNGAGLYNPGTGQQTVQVKIKGSGPGAYPHFISKMAVWPSTPGWSIFTGGSAWALSVRSETTGERRIQATTPNVFDNQWHTLTVVFYDSAGSRWVKRFTDAIRVADVTATVNLGATYGNIASPAPLTLGWGADPTMNAVTYNPADVTIFNTALTDNEVVSNLCLRDISQHPKYANVIGYWPCNDGYGGRLKNMLPNNSNHFNLKGPFQWGSVSDLPCTSTPNSDPNVTSFLVKAVDVVPTIFYWLRIPTTSSWGFEGSSWISQYEIEFVKL